MYIIPMTFKPHQTFFILDDYAEMRKVIRETVTLPGDTIYEYESAEDIIIQYEKYHPDWVLMDIQMKPVNGIQATANLVQSFPQAKVIIVTNFDEPHYRKMASRIGATGFVLKDNLAGIRPIIDGTGGNSFASAN